MGKREIGGTSLAAGADEGVRVVTDAGGDHRGELLAMGGRGDLARLRVAAEEPALDQHTRAVERAEDGEVHDALLGFVTIAEPFVRDWRDHLHALAGHDDPEAWLAAMRELDGRALGSSGGVRVRREDAYESRRFDWPRR